MEVFLKTILLLLTVQINYIALGMEIEVTDDLGRKLILQQTAKRIVSLAPHITENIFAAGAGKLIVGVDSYSDYPKQVKAIPKVGNYNNIDVETILALEPDLIIAWYSGNQSYQFRKLIDLGLMVYLNEPKKLEDIANNIMDFGKLTGNAEQAKKVTDKFIEELKSLKISYANLEEVSVFYQIWHHPIYTINGQHIISDVMRLCGGRNIFKDLSTLSPQISIESVIVANPEAIIANGIDGIRPTWLDDWSKWTSVQAVQNDNLFFIPPDLIHRHTTRIILGAKKMCEQLQDLRN